MRAIEGGWTPRRAVGPDVGAAVAAAQVAVEAVLSGSEADEAEQRAFGRPIGLPGPRNNRRDDLKQIDGLGPADELTLNRMGIFHFEQVASLGPTEVLWLENNVFSLGRIGREQWQQQARELASGAKPGGPTPPS
jgi:NADH-quinone oxidoreductase subunit E